MPADLCVVGLVKGKRSDIERYDFKESGKTTCGKERIKHTRFIFRRRLLVIHVCKATHVRIFEPLRGETAATSRSCAVTLYSRVDLKETQRQDPAIGMLMNEGGKKILIDTYLH